MPTSSGSSTRPSALGPRLLADHVVALTGAETPFGRALAQGLADAGARLIFPTLATSKTTEDLRAVGGLGGLEAVEGATELPIADDSRDALTAALTATSVPPIDALVHARIPAGALEAGPIAETTDAQWQARCEDVVLAALAAMQAGFSALRARGGAIILITPTHSLAGVADFAAYAAGNEAVRGLARSAAKQWGRVGITVNCVAPTLEALLGPGAMGTGRLALGDPPLELTGDARHDVAPAVAFLASRASRTLTGGSLRADGGVWTAG